MSETRKEQSSIEDASHLYKAERVTFHLERPDFRIAEMVLAPKHFVPWHAHNHVGDTFYVVEGKLVLHLRNPDTQVDLLPGQSFAVEAGRPHLVTNGGDKAMTILVLQGVGRYDYVPLR